MIFTALSLLRPTAYLLHEEVMSHDNILINVRGVNVRS